MFFETKWNNQYILLYKLIHIISGILLAISAIPYEIREILFIFIIIYQFGQLLLNRRYFFHINKLEKGNSIEYTMNKLFDYILGYCIMWIILN